MRTNSSEQINKEVIEGKRTLEKNVQEVSMNPEEKAYFDKAMDFMAKMIIKYSS